MRHRLPRGSACAQEHLAREIIRSITSLRQSPLSPAPRRIRSTLYCVGVMPCGLGVSAQACSSTA